MTKFTSKPTNYSLRFQYIFSTKLANYSVIGPNLEILTTIWVKDWTELSGNSSAIKVSYFLVVFLLFTSAVRNLLILLIFSWSNGGTRNEINADSMEAQTSCDFSRWKDISLAMIDSSLIISFWRYSSIVLSFASLFKEKKKATSLFCFSLKPFWRFLL